jgi:tetratricopeptide (TPR) repeat protein
MATTLMGMRTKLDKALAGLVAVAIGLSFCPASAEAAKRKAPKKRQAVSAASKKASASQASALVQAGLERLERKEYSPAIDAFSKAARAKGDSASYFLLGYAYYQRGFMAGDPDQADKQDALETVNAYTTALALDPELSEVAQPYKLHHSMAMSYEALGSYEKALDSYKKAFAAAPHNPMLPLYAARLRFRMNDMAKSAANLDLALSLAKKGGKAKSLVNLVQTDGKFSIMLASDAHMETLRKYDAKASAPAAAPMESRPAASPAAFATAGYGIASAAQYSAPAPRVTVADAAAASAAQNDAIMRDAAGVRDSVRGTIPAPAEEASRTLRRQDKDVLDALSMGNDDFKFRKYREAIQSYEDALAFNQGSGILTPSQAAFIHERVGIAYNRLGQSTEAIRALRKCVQLAPMNAGAHYQLSLAYSVMGRYQESMRALSETFRTAPSQGDLKKYMLLSKTDPELEGVRDQPGFKSMIDEHGARAYAVAR